MSENIQKAKAALRAKVREQSKALSAAEKVASSALVCLRMKQQAIWVASPSILLYAPLADEPDIWPLVEEALEAGKLVALPRFVPGHDRFIACVVRNPSQEVHPGQFGVREPNGDCPEIPLKRLDLILVPGVGFDLNGRRLGRGKGYYDQWLANYHGTTCGVAFDQQIVGEIPVEPHDIRLSCILTPTRWREANSRRAVLE